MSKKNYLALISIITAIVIAGGLYFNIFRGGLWQDSADSSGKVLSDSGTLKQFENIRVDLGSVDISVVPGENYSYTCSIASQNKKPEISLKNGTLTIQNTAGSHGIRVVGFATPSKITVTVPRDTELNSMDVDLGAGDVNLEDMNIKEVTTDLAAGDFSAGSCTFGSVKCDLAAGDCRLKDTDLSRCKIDVAAGDADLNLRGTREDYQYDLDASIGSIRVGQEKYGEEYVSDSGTGNTIQVDSSVGDIRISFV